MFGLTLEQELRLHEQICKSVVLTSPIVFLACLFLRAPWGKTSTDQWWVRPVLPPRISWFIFESPTLVWSYICLREMWPPNWLNAFLLHLFVLHYVQRSIVYPLLMSENSKRLPLLMAASAVGYCSLNGYLQARSLTFLHPIPEDYVYNPLFALGLVLFVGGSAINLHSDAILRRLSHSRRVPPRGRQRRSTSSSTASAAGYRIPRGGLFRYVSAPHFLGEVLEWTGFALLCRGSWAAVSFAAFTAANLVPRALAHHAWYRRTFGVSAADDYDGADGKYPRRRAAIVPFLC